MITVERLLVYHFFEIKLRIDLWCKAYGHHRTHIAPFASLCLLCAVMRPEMIGGGSNRQSAGCSRTGESSLGDSLLGAARGLMRSGVESIVPPKWVISGIVHVAIVRCIRISIAEVPGRSRRLKFAAKSLSIPSSASTVGVTLP